MYDKRVCSPTANGQNDRLISNPYANDAAAPYATSNAISLRPRARGRSPAPMPTHAQPNIWYGSHGPTPPVMSADANSVVHPSAKPKPGPSARPPITSKKNTSSTPAVPAPNGRSAAPSAESTPSSARAFESSPPAAMSASTTASTRRSAAPNMNGAIADTTSSDCGLMMNGHANAMRPKTDATMSA